MSFMKSIFPTQVFHISHVTPQVYYIDHVAQKSVLYDEYIERAACLIHPRKIQYYIHVRIAQTIHLTCNLPMTSMVKLAKLIPSPQLKPSPCIDSWMFAMVAVAV